jgi:hypothetical protein
VLQRTPRVRPVADGAATLEQVGGEAEAPRIIDAQVVEDATLRARPVPGTPAVGFAAFLDGVQASDIIGWDAMAPVVVGTVAAAVRSRVERRLVAWRSPVVERRIYAPFAYTPRAPWEEMFSSPVLRDTSAPDRDGVIPPAHPLALLERAKHAVSRDRDALEQRLAEQWCDSESAPLFIDGGIGGSDVVARAPCAVGVIKSHRTIWVDGPALATVLALGKGERSSVIRIAPRDRTSVHSWYLRLRDVAGHDSLGGLVRVEVAESDEPTRRADEVSRWVLAETAPLALPDTRWDKMAYGVRSCEEFLRAIT